MEDPRTWNYSRNLGFRGLGSRVLRLEKYTHDEHTGQEVILEGRNTARLTP